MSSFEGNSKLGLFSGVSNILDKDGSKMCASSLAGKVVGIYFSAHWCPPCRGFTPQLAAKYKEIVAAGHPFEIIFVSSDRDEASAAGYYGEMPWKMLDFSARDIKGELSKAFNVSGIPTLVLLNPDGSLLTADGREAIMETAFDQLSRFAEIKAEEERRLKNPNKFSLFSDADIICSKDGSKSSVSSLAGKTIGIYFSAHWCPPCRGFTPQLAAKYKEIVAAGHPFEIIFVSSDRDEASAAGYYGEMPWKMLDFSARKIKNDLATSFEVSGIPTLILLNGDGTVLTNDGRTAVMSLPFEELRTFEEVKAARARAEEEAAMSMPDTLTCDCHEHELKKIKCTYRGGSFGCDVCEGQGSGWCYHCPECNFDAHLTCVPVK